MSVDCFTPYDWSRSYLLPAEVRSNVPLRGSVGLLGAHNAARGPLVEACRHTGAHPTGLALRRDRAGRRCDHRR